MEFSPSWVIDGILLLIILISAFWYAKKGFLAGVIAFGGSLVSILAAVLAAKIFSPALFQRFLAESLIARTTDMIQGNQGVMTIEEILNDLAPILPIDMLAPFLDNQTGAFDLNTPDIAQQIVANVIEPLILPLISIVLFFAVFLLCKLLINLLAAALSNVNKLPVIGSFNRLAGFLGGFLVGLMHAFLLLCLIWAILTIFGVDWKYCNQEILKASFGYQFFSQFISFL